MKAFRPVLSDRALDDLADIYEYIATENPVAAERLVEAITTKISDLANAGNRGVARENIAEGLGAFPFKQRCIYYRIVGNEFYVLRILHGKQDVTPDLFKD
jgi:plasmid stabilization system protein ParE